MYTRILIILEYMIVSFDYIYMYIILKITFIIN